MLFVLSFAEIQLFYNVCSTGFNNKAKTHTAPLVWAVVSNINTKENAFFSRSEVAGPRNKGLTALRGNYDR